MEATGSHRIAWQRGNLALYAEVALSAEREAGADANGSVVGLDTVAEQWRMGVMFGLSLLRESLIGKMDFRHVAFTIRSFRGQPGDTTLMAAAFATFHAGAKALAVDVSGVFEFDDSIGAFLFSNPHRESLGAE